MHWKSGYLPDPWRAVSEAPFEYEYHFIEYEYDQEQTSIATRIPE